LHEKIIVAPDSFKGTMGSLEACDITEVAIKKIIPDVEVVKMSIADGARELQPCSLP
jgi:glycerate 2-kinase